MQRLYALLAILVFGSLGFTVCDGPVGLGEKILMNGPVVTIGEPIPNRALFETDPTVGTLFMLSGTARDELRITSMTITLDYWNTVSQQLVRMGRAWQWDGAWMTRESDDAPWHPYTDADYNPGAPDPAITAPAWSVYNKNDVRFNLPIFMNRMEKGDYFITVNAWNSAGRHDAKSAAKLKIKYNNLAPSVKIMNPIMLNGAGSLVEPQPPEYSGYVFDPLNRPEETSLNLRYFTNSFKDLTYQIEYTVTPAIDLSFEITNEHNLDSFGAEKTVYYSWLWREWDGALPQRGIFTDRSGAIGAPIDTYFKAGDIIELDADIQNTLPSGSITPMQLVTRVSDSTGLEEYKSKGWFLYLPDSDKPFPDISFAHKVHKDADIPPDAAERVSMTRGSANYNNIAYDDDGVRELQWTLYKLKDTGFEVDKWAGADVITFDGSKKESWSFNADKSYGTGRFKIVVRVQDIYDVWGDEYHGYFTITSNSIPTVVTPLDSPDSLTTTFWGDSSGNITIAGRAQIEDYDDCDGIDHGVRVHEIAIAWIKPGMGAENNFRYSDTNDPLWNASDGAPHFTDAYGNKIWRTGVTFVPATTGNKNDNFQEEWAFEQTLNYFTDLGIGMGADKLLFGDQQFRIRVTGGAMGAPRYSVYSFGTRGDMAAPVVDITHIVIQNSLGSSSYNMGTYNTLPPIAQNDKIMLKGTWSDDSIAQWAGLGSSRHIECLSALDVNWDGETRKFNFNVESFTLDSSGGGNWETGWYAFDDHNTDPIIQITASLTDMGGRPGTGNTVLVVETTEAVLVRISSAQSDGYYGENKQTVAEESASRYIDLFLEFNKPITFLPDSGAPALTYNNAPRLELNNGGEAFYVSGNGTSRIVFRYFVNGIVNPPLSAAVAGKGGGDSPVETGNSEGRLNVSSVNFNGFGESVWQSLTGYAAVFNKDGNGRLHVCDPSNIFSLAGQKRIIIDKTPPAITGVSTSAWTETHHGRDSQINIEVTFNKNISITGAGAANTYLTLTGGNLDSFAARAGFEHAKDSGTLNFLYTVLNGHDTSGYSQFLGVSNAVFGVPVTDAAGNLLPTNPAIPGSPVYLNGVVIDTKPPDPPLIAGVNSNQSYYSGANFYITGLEPGGGAVEYHLNHPASGVAETGWVTYAGTISGGQTGIIPLTLNGTYHIAARQYDTATTPNCSAPSQVIGPVRLDSGAILERMRSSLPDGAYSAEVPAKNTITVDLEFRVPLTLAGTYSANNLPPVTVANITLNTSGGDTNLARLSGAPANSKKWTFEYVIPHGAGTPPNTFLAVTGIDLDGLTINDQYGTRVNGPNGWIQLGDLAPENTFSSQKKMTVLAGPPRVVNPEVGYGIVFTGTQLRLNFDRDIYRGKTAEKIILRQIDDGFRIPAALSETRWNDVFINREEMFTEQGSLFGITPTYGGSGYLSVNEIAMYNAWRDGAGARANTWRSFGDKLYQKGSNGASPQGDNRLVSDTAVKYVLYFDADPDDNNFTEEVDLSGAHKTATMNLLRTAFRASEALTFIPNDREVTIQGSTLTIDLSAGGRPLPVKGARYEWIFPNGFVQDALGTANGTGEGGNAAPTGTDTNLTSGTTPNGERVLFYATAAEPPVIRIDKGSDIPVFNNNTVDRQVLQPVTTRVKINSRTPNATVTYWVRQTTDSVSKLILAGRAGTSNMEGVLGGWVGKLPTNVNSYADDAHNAINDWNNNIVMRPQTGTAGYTAPAGVDPVKWAAYGQTWWEDMSANWGAARNYAPDFTVGSENYMDGGMIINIRARSAATGVTNTNDDYGYESAYRSVFVSHKQRTHWRLPSGETSTNGTVVNGDGYPIRLHQLAAGDPAGDNPFAGVLGSFFPSGLDRVWIRGSNNIVGDTSIPDFPLSRDLSKSRKAKLLTPIDVPLLAYDIPFTANDIPVEMERTYETVWDEDEEAYIPTSTVSGISGSYMWFWVTWRINVPAFIDVFHGELPADANDPYQTPRTKLRYIWDDVGIVQYKQYHAVFPGRTTAVIWPMPTGAFYENSFTAPPRSD